jgi:hypothetical protein
MLSQESTADRFRAVMTDLSQPEVGRLMNAWARFKCLGSRMVAVARDDGDADLYVPPEHGHLVHGWIAWAKTVAALTVGLEATGQLVRHPWYASTADGVLLAACVAFGSAHLIGRVESDEECERLCSDMLRAMVAWAKGRAVPR